MAGKGWAGQLTHPLGHGNGRFSRARGTAKRFCSPGAQSWLLACLLRAVQGADGLLAGVLDKAQFWQRWAGTPMNARQTGVLNCVLDGMEVKPTNAKWAAIGECSADTALRDINDLLARGVLGKLEGGGRSTGCLLVK